MRRLLFAAALAMLLPASAQARHPSPTSSGFVLAQTAGNLQYPVEQESPNFFFNNCGGDPQNPACDPSTWVNNPTACAWDLDDYLDVTGNGALSAGGVALGSLCVVADGYDSYGGDNHLVSALVTAGSPNLTVTLANDQGYQETAAPVDNGRDWLYRICHVDLTGYPNAPAWYPVMPGSNGGTGIPVNYTLTVFSSKRASGVSAVLQAGHGIYSIC